MEALQPLSTTTLDLPPPPQTVSSVDPYCDVVVPWPQAGVAGTAIWQRLRERGDTGPLSSVSRLLDRLAPPPRTPRGGSHGTRAAQPKGTVGMPG